MKNEIKNEYSINEDTKTKNTINENEKKENKYINTDTDNLHSKINKKMLMSSLAGSNAAYVQFPRDSKLGIR